MPVVREIASFDSRLNTRPSAVICAATQPRYEIMITAEQNISTPLP